MHAIVVRKGYLPILNLGSTFDLELNIISPSSNHCRCNSSFKALLLLRRSLSFGSNGSREKMQVPPLFGLMCWLTTTDSLLTVEEHREKAYLAELISAANGCL
jgi:hypothetical protein